MEGWARGCCVHVFLVYVSDDLQQLTVQICLRYFKYELNHSCAGPVIS